MFSKLKVRMTKHDKICSCLIWKYDEKVILKENSTCFEVNSTIFNSFQYFSDEI